MELPKPPMWYWMATKETPPPAVPSNENLRSFGLPDFDESEFAEDPKETMASKCRILREKNRAMVLAFADILKKESEAEAASEENLLEPVEADLTSLHEAVGRLRLHEARDQLCEHLDHDIKERVEAVRRFRHRMASCLARVSEMLEDDDYFDHEKHDLKRYYDEKSLVEALKDPASLKRPYDMPTPPPGAAEQFAGGPPAVAPDDSDFISPPDTS